MGGNRGLLGRKLGGRYQILERLGAGGMGVVYQAHDTWLDRTVAVKVLRPELAADREFLRRFRREARAAASLSHPNIVSVFDVGQEGEIHYLVMEYVPGSTLQQRLERGPLSPEEVLRIVSLVAAALEHAHAHDVVHRDIKPQNILLGSGGQVKVTDFGIARAGVASTVTHAGAIVGSVHYLAPEQIQGNPGDRQADIYSLGIVLYQMLTGQVPFQGDNPISVALKHVQEEPPPVRRLASRTPPELERVVRKALRKNPEERYASAAEMLQDLEGVAAAVARLAGRDASLENSRPRGSRPRLAAWVTLVLLLLALLAYGVYAFLQWWHVPVLTTPEVLRLEITRAEEILRTQGLQYAVVGQLHSSEVEVSRVIDQDPEPGEPIKKGGLVKLWLSLGPEFVKGGVPGVEGKNLREAEEILRSAGLQVSVEYRYDNTQPAEVVLSQRPRAGDPAVKGSSVELEVSQGPEPQPTAVPWLYGLTLEQATARLKEAGLVPGSVEEVANALGEGLVVGQTPLAGETVPRGTVVNLRRSKGTSLSVRRSLVAVRVPGSAQDTHLVRVEVSDELGTTVVFSGQRPGGSGYPLLVTWAGEKAKVKVISDGQVVSELELSG